MSGVHSVQTQKMQSVCMALRVISAHAPVVVCVWGGGGGGRVAVWGGGEGVAVGGGGEGMAVWVGGEGVAVWVEGGCGGG